MKNFLKKFNSDAKILFCLSFINAMSAIWILKLIPSETFPMFLKTLVFVSLIFNLAFQWCMVHLQIPEVKIKSIGRLAGKVRYRLLHKAWTGILLLYGLLAMNCIFWRKTDMLHNQLLDRISVSVIVVFAILLMGQVIRSFYDLQSICRKLDEIHEVEQRIKFDKRKSGETENE